MFLMMYKHGEVIREVLSTFEFIMCSWVCLQYFYLQPSNGFRCPVTYMRLGYQWCKYHVEKAPLKPGLIHRLAPREYTPLLFLSPCAKCIFSLGWDEAARGWQFCISAFQGMKFQALHYTDVIPQINRYNIPCHCHHFSRLSMEWTYWNTYTQLPDHCCLCK